MRLIIARAKKDVNNNKIRTSKHRTQLRSHQQSIVPLCQMNKKCESPKMLHNHFNALKNARFYVAIRDALNAHGIRIKNNMINSGNPQKIRSKTITECDFIELISFYTGKLTFELSVVVVACDIIDLQNFLSLLNAFWILVEYMNGLFVVVVGISLYPSLFIDRCQPFSIKRSLILCS